MKIAPKQSESFLANPQAGCHAVLLYGPDGGAVRERAGRIRQKLLGGSDDPFAFVELEESRLLADPALLADEISAISLMSPLRLILVRGAGDKLTKIIESASDIFHKGAFLVLMADELSTRSSLRAWFEKRPDAAALACYKDEIRDVQALVARTLEEAQVRAGREVVGYLAEQLGNDRFITRQELEKIVLYAGPGGTLSLAEAQALVGYNRDATADEVVNAVADRSLSTLDLALHRILREAVQPIIYLRALQRYFNKLYAMRLQVDAGASIEQVIASARPPIFFRQAPITTRHVQQWSAPQLVRALALLVEAELAIKTSDLPPIAASSRKLMAVTQIQPRRTAGSGG